jgi:hypothetical protein
MVERRGIRMKINQTWIARHNFQQQIHSGPRTLKITQIIQSQYLNIFQVHFWYKSLFLLFFSFWIERGKEKVTRFWW